MATLVRTLIRAGPKTSPAAVCVVVPKRGIMSRTMRSGLPPRPPKPKPFDYENKFYTYLRSIIDRTTHRFDENSKVIVVEGPIAVGKTSFASKLAEELEMKHFPEVTMDWHYIKQGIDLRQFNCVVPPSTRCFDEKDFCMCPTDPLAGAFQLRMYNARYSQYVDALAHVLNTGQGVVLERSPYSDFVFIEAMTMMGYVSRGVRSVYYDVRHYTLGELLRPHLVVYLDASVPDVLAKVQCRGRPHETTYNRAFNNEYLSAIEHMYKHRYLKEMEPHAELLVYDWTNGGEVEVVVEDIERLDMDKPRIRTDLKHKDWRLEQELEWAGLRMAYTTRKDFLMNQFNVPRLDVPELIHNPEDIYERNKIIYSHPDFEYLQGYSRCDTGLLTKNSSPKYIEFF